MNNDLRILLSATLDTVKVIDAINKQISEISQKVSDIKLNITIDPTVMSKMDSLAKFAENYKNITNDLNQVIKQEETVIKNLDGSISKLTTQYLKSGEIIEKNRTSIDNARKAKEQDAAITLSLADAEKVYGDKLRETQNLTTGNKSTTFGDKYTQTKVNSDASGNVIGDPMQTQNYQKELQDIEKLMGEINKQEEKNLQDEQKYNDNLKRIASERKLIRDQLQALDSTGFLTDTNKNSINQSLVNSKSLEDIQRIKQEMNQIESSIKTQTQYQQQQNKVLAQQYQQEQKIAEQAKLAADKEAVRVSNLGQNVGSVSPGAFTGDYAQASAKMQQYIQSVNGANTAVTSLQRSTNAAGQEVWKYTAAVDNGKNGTDIIKGSIDKTTGSMYELSKSTRQVGNDVPAINNFGNSIKTAMSYFGAFGVATSAFSFFSQGIQYINDMNKSLTEISIEQMKNQDQVAGLASAYQKLGDQLGATSTSIASGAAELYRQGLSQDQVMARLKDVTTYSKISSLDFKQATEIVTTATNSMNVSSQKAIDTFSYLGRHNCPLAS